MTHTPHPPVWNLAANPIFRRHLVARLRPLPVILGLFLVQVLGASIWALSVLVEIAIRSELLGLPTDDIRSPMELAAPTSYAMGWGGILVLQAFLTLSKGSFSTVTGVARESHEGMIDAQYLMPLPTGHKVLGQLFGYPVFDNFLAVSLLPWAAASAIFGGFSALTMAKVYLLFAISVIFYQSLSLTVGTLVRQKILAATFSQILVLSLVILPQVIGGTGVGMLSYMSVVDPVIHEITIDPSIRASTIAMAENIEHALVESDKEDDSRVDASKLDVSFSLPPNSSTNEEDTAEDLTMNWNVKLSESSRMHFFHWEIDRSGYYWMVMLGCVAATLTILWRRWNDRSSQLLGKPLTAFAALVFCFMTLGEVLPYFWNGLPPPSWAFSIAAAILSIQPAAIAVPNLASICWVASLALGLTVVSLLFISTLVPSRSARTRCRLMQSSPWWMDGREALPWVLGISFMFGATWCVAAQSMAGEAGPGISKAPVVFDYAAMIASFIVPAAAWYALAAWKGAKSACFAGFVMWFIPPLLTVIATLYRPDSGDWISAILAPSAPIAPASIASHAFGTPLSFPMKASLFASLAAHAAAAVFILLHTLRERRAKSPSPSPDPAAATR